MVETTDSLRAWNGYVIPNTEIHVSRGSYYPGPDSHNFRIEFDSWMWVRSTAVCITLNNEPGVEPVVPIARQNCIYSPETLLERRLAEAAQRVVAWYLERQSNPT